MFFLLFLNILFDDINWKGCETKENGFTCDELEKGIKIFKIKIEILNQIPKNSTYISVLPKNNKVFEDILYTRILELVLALYTNSIPYHKQINSFKNIKEDFEDNQWDNDLISVDNMKYENYSLCFETKKLDYNTTFYVDTFSSLLMLTIPSFELMNELGPAYLHILSHYLLNITEKQEHSINTTSKKEYIQECLTKNINLTLENDFLTMITKGDRNAHLIGNLKGWLAHIVTGRKSFIIDPSSKACWKGKTYLSGGISAIYSYTHRSDNDLRFINTQCRNTSNTKEMLKYVL